MSDIEQDNKCSKTISLADYGFPNEVVGIHCRICGELITRVFGATLLHVPVKYGKCRKTSHGITIMKVHP